MFFKILRNSSKIVFLHVFVSSAVPSASLATEILTTSKFDYEEGTACDFHEKKDIQKYCALGYAAHRAMMIFHNVRARLGIPKTAGHKNLQRSKENMAMEHHAGMDFMLTRKHWNDLKWFNVYTTSSFFRSFFKCFILIAQFYSKVWMKLILASAFSPIPY